MRRRRSPSSAAGCSSAGSSSRTSASIPRTRSRIGFAAGAATGRCRIPRISTSSRSERERVAGGSLVNKPMIFPLFSAPLYVSNVGDFPRPDLEALEYTSTMPGGGSYNFLSSVDKNVLHRPEFAHIHEIVMREVEMYTRELLGVSSRITF